MLQIFQLLLSLNSTTAKFNFKNFVLLQCEFLNQIERCSSSNATLIQNWVFNGIFLKLFCDFGLVFSHKKFKKTCTTLNQNWLFDGHIVKYFSVFIVTFLR